MAKKLYDAIVKELECLLDGLKVDLLSAEQGTKINEDGSQEFFTRVELEIPKGHGSFSRCRFSCKLPMKQIDVSEDDFDAGVSAILSNVKVTYISGQKEIYTKASSLELV